MSMSRIRIVLVRPQIAGNIGAVARLMENFTAGDLYLVAPEADPHSPEAFQRSTHGQARLESARAVDSISAALEGVSYAIGTSRRSGPVHQDRDLLPRDLAPVLREHTTRGDVAFLFGSEDNGLSRDELLLCDAILQIPASPEYPTLNLSHAVAICLYESFLALADKDQTDLNTRQPAEPADLALIARLTEKLQASLTTIGYLHSDKPDHLMFPIRAILSRAQLSRTEAQILIGLAQQIDTFARTGKPHR